MSANIKCFLDENCTKELGLTELGAYAFRLGPDVGMNGDTGETWTTTLYLKNVGTRATLNTCLYIDADPFEFVTVTPIELGDFKELEVKPFSITVTVPRWTRYQVQVPNIYIDYYTLPEIDEVYHNPYQDVREVAE